MNLNKPLALILFLAAITIGCSSKVDRNFFCSTQSNDLRRKFHIPVIDGDMKVDDSSNLFRSYWSSPQKYPRDSALLHAWKVIVPGRSILSFESDAFRKKIDDTLLFQLNIDSKIHKDSTVSVSGLIFYTLTNESKSISLDFDNQYKSLDSLGVESVKKSWNLQF